MVNGWSLSGSEIHSSGEPVFLGVSGSSIFSGATSASSYADEGGIYGGAMSSGLRSATNGRPPYIGRNSIPMPRWNNADLRLARKFPIHETMAVDLSLDAFNFAEPDHRSGCELKLWHRHPGFAVPPRSPCLRVQRSLLGHPCGSGRLLAAGLLQPLRGVGATAFNQKSTTSSNLYGPRQLQFAAKFTF